ncbi:TonB-dependent receptor [Nitratireductor aquibiodomus RA22]|uniref:TonB-dependent receptor n=1 Tax=Nitratireductor aquibiodomus RA22 TaxID=1189611 RepID=I5BVC9_9HYPH|nr:TonB-dependent receptor [Nitratireductor aquibiodomus]EIM73531.1 TonB-dependent receptor [Nitratireductor aquibiodomus RA22]
MTSIFSSNLKRGVSLFALFLSISTGASFAQEAPTGEPDQPATDEAGGTLLDAIIITARKRLEFDLDIPVSTSVLPGESLPATTLDPGGDISRQSPNLNYADFARPSDRYGTLRSVGPLGSPLNSLDSTVGFAIDGVPTSAFGYGQPLFDVDRVEVLRGPQGTLFGRNALGGLINVVPRGADGEREFRIDTQIGSNGFGQAEAVAGGWLIPDSLAGRGALFYQTFDGDVPNGIIGGEEGGVDLKAGRGSLRFTPDATLTIDVTGSYSSDHRNNVVWLLKEHPDFPVSGSDITPVNNRDIGQGTVKITKDFDTLSLTSVTSYQDIRIRSADEFTDSYIFGRWLGVDPAAFVDPDDDVGSVKEREEIFSQEFRLNSAEGSDWDWVAGVSYFRSDFNTHRVMNSSMWPTSNGTTDNDVNSETFAVFADVTAPLGERFEISGGLRLAHDRQDFTGRFVSNGAAGIVPSLHQQNSFSDTYLTGRAALSYAWTDDIRSYVSVARGYSSGGFERTAQNSAYGTPAEPFRPATGWTYEIGTKAQLNDAISVSGAVFYNDVTDGQLTGFDNATAQVFFANQDYRSYGFELQASAELGHGFELSAGVGYTKSRLEGQPTPNLPIPVEGNRVPHAPEWTANLGLGYRKAGEDIGLSGDFYANASYQYVGARYPDVQNSVKMDAYHIVNAKIGWENERVGVNAFVNNLLDERPIYYATAYSSDVTAVIAGRGRVFGVGASLKW